MKGGEGSGPTVRGKEGGGGKSGHTRGSGMSGLGWSWFPTAPHPRCRRGRVRGRSWGERRWKVVVGGGGVKPAMMLRGCTSATAHPTRVRVPRGGVSQRLPPGLKAFTPNSLPSLSPPRRIKGGWGV